MVIMEKDRITTWVYVYQGLLVGGISTLIILSIMYPKIESMEYELVGVKKEIGEVKSNIEGIKSASVDFKSLFVDHRHERHINDRIIFPRRSP